MCLGVSEGECVSTHEPGGPGSWSFERRGYECVMQRFAGKMSTNNFFCTSFFLYTHTQIYIRTHAHTHIHTHAYKGSGGIVVNELSRLLVLPVGIVCLNDVISFFLS